MFSTSQTVCLQQRGKKTARSTNGMMAVKDPCRVEGTRTEFDRTSNSGQWPYHFLPASDPAPFSPSSQTNWPMEGKELSPSRLIQPTGCHHTIQNDPSDRSRLSRSDWKLCLQKTTPATSCRALLAVITSCERRSAAYGALWTLTLAHLGVPPSSPPPLWFSLNHPSRVPSKEDTREQWPVSVMHKIRRSAQRTSKDDLLEIAASPWQWHHFKLLLVLVRRRVQVFEYGHSHPGKEHPQRAGVAIK